MTSIIKKKLCWNCEGRVSSQEENCPLCGVYINGTLNMQDSSHEEDSEDTEPLDENRAHAPLYTPQETVVSTEKESASEEASATTSLTSYNKEFLSLLSLSIGGLLFFFSLVLVLFADNGLLTLQWDASLWFVYLLIALPALLLGWKLGNE